MTYEIKRELHDRNGRWRDAVTIDTVDDVPSSRDAIIEWAQENVPGFDRFADEETQSIFFVPSMDRACVTISDDDGFRIVHARRPEDLI